MLGKQGDPGTTGRWDRGSETLLEGGEIRDSGWRGMVWSVVTRFYTFKGLFPAKAPFLITSPTCTCLFIQWNVSRLFHEQLLTALFSAPRRQVTQGLKRDTFICLCVPLNSGPEASASAPQFQLAVHLAIPVLGLTQLCQCISLLTHSTSAISFLGLLVRRFLGVLS